LALGACGNNNNDVMKEIEKREAADAQSAQQAANASQAFIESAKQRPGAVTTPSGLVYVFTHHSSNQRLAHPVGNSVVLVHYEGKLANGTVFDSSFQRNEPAQFPLDQVVPGFSEVIQLMRPGDEVVATFPPALGYGARGQPPVIPPNSALQFRIQLLAFQGANGQLVQAPRG
jgi:FKBP-type peptidyl-prolyl cis-trans isomerase